MSHLDAFSNDHGPAGGELSGEAGSGCGALGGDMERG